MKKKRLVELISKYNVAKTEQVIYKCLNKEILVEAKTENKNLRITVKLKDSILEDGSFGILDTKTFKAMLSVLNEDIAVKYDKSGDDIISLNIRDTNKRNVKIVTGNLSIFEEVEPVKTLPSDYPVVMNISDEFIRDFTNSMSALNVDSFSISRFTDINNVKLMFGFNSHTNTDTITIPLKNYIDKSKDKAESIGELENEVYFDARSLLEILTVNKEIAESGKILIHDRLIRIEYNTADFECQYLMVSLDV